MKEETTLEVNSPKVRVFFAIPCGEFYKAQRDIIVDVCGKAGLEPTIVEDDLETKGLLDKIRDGIDKAEFFAADISSGLPNIMIEFGYAMKAKPLHHCAIFSDSVARVPTDIQDPVRQVYSSLQEFQQKLAAWLKANVPVQDRSSLDDLRSDGTDVFSEDFMSQDRFLRLWALPPQCRWFLTHKGLRMTGSYFPIMTRHLALAGDHAFEFKAKIVNSKIGWVVMGTTIQERRPYYGFPAFCLMFNLDNTGKLTPHIGDIAKQSPPPYYHVYETEAVEVNKKEVASWFTVRTEVRGSTVVILLNDKKAFDQEFSEAPYSNAYCAENRQNDVGFRCDGNEEALIRRMKVTTL